MEALNNLSLKQILIIAGVLALAILLFVNWRLVAAKFQGDVA